MKKLYLIILTIFLTFSCGMKISKINDARTFTPKCYLKAGEENVIKKRPSIFIKTDSLSYNAILESTLTKIKVKTSDVDRITYSKLYSHNRFTKKQIKPIQIVISKAPNLKLRIYPYDLNDTIEYNNLRFLKVYLSTDSNFYEEIDLQVDRFYYHFNDNIIRVSDKSELNFMDVLLAKTESFSSITIDEVVYTKDNIVFNEKVNYSKAICYKNNIYCGHGTDQSNHFYPGEHTNSIGSMIMGICLNKSKEFILSLQDSTVNRNCEILVGFNERCSFINLGDLPGFNTITVRDISGKVIFDKRIDGRNQRIEYFIPITKKQELFFEIKGKFNFNFKATFS